VFKKESQVTIPIYTYHNIVENSLNIKNKFYLSILK